MSLLKNLLPLFIIFQSSFVCAQNNYIKTGMASYYADKFEGRKTASGEVYQHSKLTAAHPTLPFGTTLKVTNTENGKSVIVRVNDRGPFVKGRIIDLSKSAAIKIDLITKGVAKVKVEQVQNNSNSDIEQNSTINNNNGNEEKNEYYQINVSLKAISGYGVQIGSFNQMGNLIRTSSSIEKVVVGDFFVKTSKINGKTVTQLIVGVESNKSKAQKHMEELKKTFPDCFVIKL